MLDIIAALIGKMFFFTGYVREGSFPEPLSADEEAAVIKRMLAGDVAARGELIERNLRLVAHIAKKYASPRRDADDLISIGTIGLIKAVSTYNKEKSSTLATYASRCIDNAILSQRNKQRLRCTMTTPLVRICFTGKAKAPRRRIRPQVSDISTTRSGGARCCCLSGSLRLTV